MKKYLTMLLFIFSIASFNALATAEKTHDTTLDFTLTYKTPDNSERVMKNTSILANKKWVVAGKLVSHNEDVLLFLVRMLSHKNNKYNLEFMLIDSDHKKTYISMPQVKAMTGLPVKVAQKDGESVVELNVLVKT